MTIFTKIKEAIQKKKWMEGDLVVWMILILLCGISIIEVYSASSRDSYKKEYYDPVIQHGTFVVIGMMIAWVLHKVPCKFFKIINTFSLLFLAFPMMIYTMFSSTVINDTSRWIKLGGYTFQPSELTKITLIGFTAFILSTLRTKSGRASDGALKFVGIVTFVCCCIIGKENLSTAAIIFVVIFAMLWLADANRKVLLICGLGLLLAGGLGVMTVKSMSEETVQEIANFQVGKKKPLERFSTWAHRLKDKEERPKNPAEYDITKDIQVTHATMAVANSNIIGLGPGKSVQRDFLPEANCDFIYSIIIEEGGIEFGGIVMFLYLLLFYRSMKIAQQCATRFPAYLVMGLSLMMVFQAMVNMGVAVGLLPVTGQPLPLISKGGSSGFITCSYIGMILSVSRSAKKVSQTKENELQPIPAA